MDKKLSKGAYEGVEGKNYVPYVTNGPKIGGNVPIMVIGVILAILFAASTAYSGMKSGLTVAAGIPGSIIGSGLIALFAKKNGIFSKNLVQGMSSGGESVASGMIFVLPAVFLIGANVSFLEGFVVGVGGVLFGTGVAALVYNYLIVEEHGKLSYPESMAISETLVASEGAGESMKYMGIGFAVGGIITFVSESFMNFANNVMSYVNETYYKWKLEIEVNPLLLGIGFIVGLEVSLTMFAGSILANFGIMPLIGYFSEFAKEGEFVWNDPNVLVNAMQVNNIGGSYVKYIGAGMMLSGGIIGAVKLIPTIIVSLKETFKGKSSTNENKSSNLILILGLVVGLVAAYIISQGNILMTIVVAILSFLLAFLFVIVSGRLTGTIGTSNLPVSGMTIASLVIITLLFVIMGWVSPENNKSLLLFGTFIVIAIAIAGGYCQSQKVTFVLGGDKREMDKYFVISSVIGVAVVVGVILLLSSKLSMTGDNVAFALPQANLISTLTTGIMSGELPWHMIIVGAVMGVVLFLLNLPTMTIAIGFYLPISTTAIILIGAIVRRIVEIVSKTQQEKETRISNGISLSSGLVAGGSIIGLIGIILHVLGVIKGGKPMGFAASNSMAFILLVALILCTILPLLLMKPKKQAK
ncbi:MAG: oligopeptide transporter, OPT family [Oscillospiraceae bacterium]